MSQYLPENGKWKQTGASKTVYGWIIYFWSLTIFYLKLISFQDRSCLIIHTDGHWLKLIIVDPHVLQIVV